MVYSRSAGDCGFHQMLDYVNRAFVVDVGEIYSVTWIFAAARHSFLHEYTVSFDCAAEMYLSAGITSDTAVVKTYVLGLLKIFISVQVGTSLRIQAFEFI